MYHGFAPAPRADDPYDLAVTVPAFEAQLGHLHRSGWTALDLDGYLATAGGGAPRRTFLVTIDDALRSVAVHGAPVLAAHGVPSVVFAPAGLLGETTRWLTRQPHEPIMTAEELRGLAGLGVEVGVHGWDHASLIGMSDAELHRNTVEAAEVVADATGRRPRAFAYPFGDLDDRAVRAVERAGFEVGFSVYGDAGPFAMSRTDVKPADTLTAVRVKLVMGPHYRVVWRAAGTVRPARGLVRRTAQGIPTRLRPG